MAMIRVILVEVVQKASTAIKDQTIKTARITKIAMVAATTRIEKAEAIVATRVIKETTTSIEIVTYLNAAKDVEKVEAEARHKKSQNKSRSILSDLKRLKLMKQ